MINKKIASLTLTMVMAVTLLTGCDLPFHKGLKGAYDNKILTLTPVDQNKEMVTVHYEYGLVNSKEIENAVEEQFPDVDMVMVHDGAANSASLLKGNLENGTECDLIFSRVLHQLEEQTGEYLLDLANEEFVSNFSLTSLDNCVLSDGGLYYLPGTSNLYGIVYDKTVLEENGWEVPTNYTEFVELIHTIDNSGLTVVETLDGETNEVPVRAFRPSLKFTDSFRNLFYPFVYEAVFSGWKNMEWVTAYQQGEESMKGHMEPMVDIMQQLYDDGVIRLDDWDYMPRYRLPMLCESHSAVMIIDSQNSYANEALRNNDHEYAMMPYFTGDEEGSDYLYAIPTYFMGINKASAQVSEERKQLLLDIMSFICSPETQEKLYGEDNTQISNIKGVNTNANSFTAGIQKTIQEGRIISDFELRAETQMLSGARELLAGNISEEQWMEDNDQCRDDMLAGITIYDPEEIGSCEETLTSLQTALLMGQVYRDLTGADIALVYVNEIDQGANCPLFEGTLTTTMVNNMAPDRTSGDGTGIASGTLTGQQIIDCLAGMKTENAQSDEWYYIASGLDVEFAPWMPAGQRLVSCKLPDGSDIDPEGTYHVAFMSDKLFGITGDEIQNLRPEDIEIVEGKWIDIFPQWLSENGDVVKAPEQTTKLNWKVEEK